KRLKSPGLHSVGGVAGLHLRVKRSGARNWILRVTVGDRRPDIGLGGYPDVGLEQARNRARAVRQLWCAGADPLAARPAPKDALPSPDARGLSFDGAAAKCWKSKGREFKNRKHAAQWKSTRDTYASPIIGELPVDKVELAHVVAVL